MKKKKKNNLLFQRFIYQQFAHCSFGHSLLAIFFLSLFFCVFKNFAKLLKKCDINENIWQNICICTSFGSVGKKKREKEMGWNWRGNFWTLRFFFFFFCITNGLEEFSKGKNVLFVFFSFFSAISIFFFFSGGRKWFSSFSFLLPQKIMGFEISFLFFSSSVWV